MTTLSAEQTPFETLLASEQARLVRFCSYLTGDSHAAEDLAQETALIAWRQRHQLTAPNGITHWLTAIARNVCRHHVRTQKRRQFHLPTLEADIQAEPFEATASATDFDIEVELERSELITLLDRALGLLPAETCGLLIQHYIEELPQAELASRFGLTTSAVAVRLHRGKVALRQALVNDFLDDAVAYGLVMPYEGTPPWAPDFHEAIYDWCDRCQIGAEANSWHSRAFCLPQIQQFWRNYPRMAEIPPHHVEIANSPAVLVGFESVTDGAKIEVAFTKNTFEVIDRP